VAERPHADAQGRLENLKELVRSMDDFDNLRGFLEHVALVMDNDGSRRADDKVSIMTLHGAKGLEFDTVFLPGWEEGLFPTSARSTRAAEGPRGGAPPRLCRHHPRQARCHISFAAEPPHPQPVAVRHAVALHRRTARVVAKSVADSPSPFKVGDRVFHQKFGNGNVAGVEGNKLTIDFDKAGQKRVLDGFVSGV
jgi:DNA helicase II / ATP-dependent DNA helicase PcrA